MRNPETDARPFARDLQMMREPNRWPQWPVLPLIKRNGSLDDKDYCAFMYATGKPVAYLGNILMLPDTLAECERRPYPTLEALAADYKVD